MHKTGYAYYTFSGVDKKIETYTDKLVAGISLKNQINVIRYGTLTGNIIIAFTGI